jgi:hypothetical protein
MENVAKGTKASPEPTSKIDAWSEVWFRKEEIDE